MGTQRNSKFYGFIFNILRIASPDPGAYPLYSDFDIGKKGGPNVTKKGLYSFGAPHEVYKNVYIPDAPV